MSGLAPFTARGAGGLPELTEDEESIAHTQPSVTLRVGDDGDQGTGTLFITTRRLVWFSDADAGKGYAVGFPQVTMHAISRDVGASPPCIYTQLEGAAGAPGAAGGGGGDEADDDMTEMRLIPSDAACLDSVFQVLCDCALMNPDPEGEDDEGDFYFDEDEVEAGAGGGAERAAMLDRFDEMLQIGASAELDELVGNDPGRFADADDDDDDDDMANGH